MRLLRLLAFIATFVLVAATPHIGRSIAAASASAGPDTSGQDAVNFPANDNDDPCDSDNPRKQKKCHFNQADLVDDNDNADDLPPALAASVSNADPEEDDTITLTLHAWGSEIAEVWWWVPDDVADDNDNDDEEFVNIAHVQSCDGADDCWRTSALTPRHEGTFTIHAKARERLGRESGEVVTEVRVHDDD